MRAVRGIDRARYRELRGNGGLCPSLGTNHHALSIERGASGAVMGGSGCFVLAWAGRWPRLVLCQLSTEVVKNATVVIGGAEHDDGRVLFDAHAVPGWPVEEVAGSATFAGTVGVGHERRSALEVTPVHRLAGIPGKPFEQRGDVSACGKCQVLGGQSSVGDTEVRQVAHGDAGNIELARDGRCGEMHGWSFRRG